MPRPIAFRLPDGARDLRRRRTLLQLGLPLLAAALIGGGAHARAAGNTPHTHSTTPTIGEALEHSTAEQLALGEHLRRVGALFYGAWWCPACFMQKNLFGKEAGNRLPYVECAKTDQDRERCQAAGIAAYPTWELNGRRVEGVQTIEELKTWSGFPAVGGGATPPARGAAPQAPTQAGATP